MLRDEQERTAKSIGEIAADLVSQSKPPEFYNQQVAHLPVKSLGAFVRPLNGSTMFRVSAGARLQTGGGKWQSVRRSSHVRNGGLTHRLLRASRRRVHSQQPSNARPAHSCARGP